MVKAVVFDLDGTTVNTLDDLMQAINLALEIKGYPFHYDLDGTKKLIGEGTKTLCKRAIASLNPSEEQWKDLFKEFTKQYNIHQLDHAHLYNGVLDAINEIKKQGIKVCTLSNKVDKNVKEIVEKLFPKNTFDYVLGQLEDMPLKPDPTGLYRVLNEIGVNKEKILYVGDSDTDMKTGKNADVTTVAVTWGFRDRDVLESFNPKYIINNPKELLELIK